MAQARRGHKTCPFPTSHKSALLKPGWLLLKSYETPKAGEAARDQLLGKWREGHTSPWPRILEAFCASDALTPVPSPTNQLLRTGRCNTCTRNIRVYLLQERAGEHCDTVWVFPEAVGGLVLPAGSLLG